MGHTKLGTLCVIDTKPRQALSEYQRETLKNLAAMVCDQLNSRLQSKKLQLMYQELQKKTAEVTAVNQELQTLIDTANAPIFAVDAEQRVTVWNRKISDITSVPPETVVLGLMRNQLSQVVETAWALFDLNGNLQGELTERLVKDIERRARSEGIEQACTRRRRARWSRPLGRSATTGGRARSSRASSSASRK